MVYWLFYVYLIYLHTTNNMVAKFTSPSVLDTLHVSVLIRILLLIYGKTNRTICIPVMSTTWPRYIYLFSITLKSPIIYLYAPWYLEWFIYSYFTQKFLNTTHSTPVAPAMLILLRARRLGGHAEVTIYVFTPLIEEENGSIALITFAFLSPTEI